MRLSRIALPVMAVLALVAGCGGGTPTTSQQATATPDRPHTTISRFDPRWMTLETPPSWTESDRAITGEFQQFGLRPVDETEMPRNCNGCGVQPPTAFLTAYTPGGFDPTPLRSGEPVSVHAGGDGFFTAATQSADAILAWQYADNAWATVRGRTTLTGEPARMLELARALQPADHTAIRLPLGIPELPATLPLAEITVDRGDYGTALHFAACGRTDIGGVPRCAVESDHMRVQIWPADGYSGHLQEKDAVPVRIGGRDGLLDASVNQAAVQVGPGMLVVFELSGPVGQPGQPRPRPDADLKSILATITWAPDPADEKTWQQVGDWAKQA